jgi:outer membrane receptor protein involved in Fe transport
LHWQLESKPYLISLSHEYEHFQNDPSFSPLDSVAKQNLRSLQLGLRWLAGTHWTVNLKWSHNQAAESKWISDSSLSGNHEIFNQLDADMSWRFNPSGVLTAGVRNATDKRFQYVEIDKVSPRFSTGRLLFTNLKMAW